MARVLRFISLGLNALSFWFGWTAAAHADPITVALFGTAFAATIPGIAVSLAFTVAINYGASLLISALAGKPEQPKQTFGVELSLQVGGDNPIAFPVGWIADGGQLVYPGTWGHDGDTPNAYAVWEILLSDLSVPDRPFIWVNEQKCTIDWDADPETQGYPVTEFRIDGKDHLWVWFSDGTQTTPSNYMRAKFANHDTRPYTDDMVGEGLAKVIVTALAEREVWSGSPTFVFETFGIPLYNIAKDGSVGGSGSHRWDDPSTWEPSSNPIVIAYNVRRGIFYYPTPNSRAGAQWVYGGNNKKPLSAYRLPASNWIAAINACDILINLSDGGTEPQFRAGAMITGDMQPIQVINQLLASCNARMAEVGGIYKVQVGAPGAAVYAFTDEHVVITDGQSFDPFPGIEDTHNAIEATYPEPGEKWGTKDAPGRYNEDWEAEDGGRTLVADATYPMVPYRYQVQRLMKAAIADARRFRNHGITLPPDAWLLEPNDIVAWTSPRNGYENKKFLVTTIYGQRGYNQVVGLKEVDPSDYDWDPDTDEVPVTIGDLVIERPAPQLMTGWQALPAVIVDNGGNSRRPSIEVRYDGLLADVRAVRVQVRLPDADGLTYDAEQPYDPAETDPARILNGVFLPATEYEVRGKYVPFSGRATSWSGWLTVTTPDIRLGPDDFWPIDISGIAPEVQGTFAYLSQSNAKLRDDMQSVVVRLQDQANGNLETFQQIRTEARVSNQALRAEYANVVTVAIGELGDEVVALATRVETIEAAYDDPVSGNSALASGLNAITTTVTAQGDLIEATSEAITSVQATVDDITAGGAARFQVGANPGGGWSRYDIAVFAQTPGNFVAAGISLDVNSDGTSRAIIAADKTFITSSNGTVLTLFDSSGGTAYIASARIPVLTADHIDASTLTLDFGQIENVSIGSAQIATGAVTNAKIANAAITTAKIGDLQVDRLKLAEGSVTDFNNDTGSGATFTNASTVTQYGSNFAAPDYPFIAGGFGTVHAGGTGSPTCNVSLIIQDRTTSAITVLDSASGSTSATLRSINLIGFLVAGRNYRLGIRFTGSNDNGGTPSYDAWGVQSMIQRK